LSDFLADLVLEELWVFEGCLVEDEDVGEGRDDEVKSTTGKPGKLAEYLQIDWKTYHMMRNREKACR